MTVVRRKPATNAGSGVDGSEASQTNVSEANGREDRTSPEEKIPVAGVDHGEDKVELVASVAFGLISLAVSLLMHRAPPSTIRPMPVQAFGKTTVLRDPMFNQPNVGITVGDGLLILLAFVCPLIVQCSIAFYMIRRRRDLHATICTYFVTFAICLLTTEAIKIYVGRLRPNFFAECQPNDDYTACTNPKRSAVAEARKSFPSGHASMIFCGMQLFTLYLLQRFGLHSNQTMMQPRRRRVISVLCLFPIAIAFWVGTSRIVDNKHFPADVIAGALLGVGCAAFGQNLWF